MEKITVRDMAQIALVAAIYIALTMTPPLNAISYGAYQFRISEMMNFMAFYKPKYIIGVTLGCMIANLFSLSIKIPPIMSEANSPTAVVNQVKKNGALATRYNSAAMVTIESEKKIAK